ncbi:hypothetical protein [Bordetella genomosp. 13]|uniref:hypothetical protein n=1 Tax=Bordetella genomosp. 13 TaxID=463040 RepID=UPI0011A3C8C0|nr:hypothetical protein [Bordetella genomosp. 13]
MTISSFLKKLFSSSGASVPTSQGADTEARVREKAALAVSRFQQRAQGRLDYSEQSLSAVEEMLAEASGHTGQMASGEVDALVNLMGSYVLEVAHRQFGGIYQWYDAADKPVLVVGRPEFGVAIMPFDKIRGRLGGDEGDHIVFFYEGFAERARTAAPGTDALYL